MEGLALTGAWVDVERGLVSIIALEMGGSSDLCSLLKPGDPVILMGPTGHAHRNPERRDRAAGRRRPRQRRAVLDRPRAARRRLARCSTSPATRRMQDRYKVGGDRGRRRRRGVGLRRGAPGFAAGRPQDRSHVGNIVEADAGAISRASWARHPIDLGEVDRIIAIGSDGMMAAVGRARHDVLKPFLKPEHCAIGIASTRRCNA